MHERERCAATLPPSTWSWSSVSPVRKQAPPATTTNTSTSAKNHGSRAQKYVVSILLFCTSPCMHVCHVSWVSAFGVRSDGWVLGAVCRLPVFCRNRVVRSFVRPLLGVPPTPSAASNCLFLRSHLLAQVFHARVSFCAHLAAVHVVALLLQWLA